MPMENTWIASKGVRNVSTYALDAPLPAALQARATQGLRSQFAKFYAGPFSFRMQYR